MATKRLFVPITKVDETQRLVYGVAALEQEDKSGEIFDYDSSKPYVQEWSAEMSAATDGRNLGNVRAMHGKVAAGRLTELHFEDTDKIINVCAKIVDDTEWNKVQEAIYTGFSIGGDYVRRWTDPNGLKRYTAKLSEVSVVDNPAMPGAHFTMVKMNGAEEQRSFAKYYSPEEQQVFVTNDMVVRRAQQMAKAAGQDKFADFIEAARTELVAKATMDAGTNGAEMIVVPPGEARFVKPSGQATIKPVTSSVQNDEEETPEGEQGKEEGKDSAVPLKTEPGNTAEGDTRNGTPVAPHGVGKATNVDPRNEVQQGWRAKDGSFHVSKAAAVAHNTSLDDPTAKALEEAIAKATSAVADAKATKADINNSKVINQEEKDKAKGGKPWVKKDDMGEAAKTAEPYGEVSYADPGYKADKKKRYPVDTEKHIRAAWSYIHKPKNQEGYTSGQVSSIKSKIVSAWKDVIGGEPPEAATKIFRINALQKGMYAVSRLACLIEELNWLQEGAEGEALFEGDNSPVPGQLKGDIASLVGTLKNMLEEESTELFEPGEAAEFADELAMAAKSMPDTELNKFIDYLGAQRLTKSNGHISMAHALLKAARPKAEMDKIQAMHDHCCSMGAKCDDGNMGKATGGGALNKAQLDALQADNDRLAKMVEKAVGALTKMADDITLIKEQPMVIPPGRVSVVEKGAVPYGTPGDGTGLTMSELQKNFSPELLAVAAMKLAHSTGGQHVTLRPQDR